MMAACESLQHIFDKSLQENPTLFEPFSSWSSIKAMEPISGSSFTELFGDLHFKENQHGESPLSCASSSPLSSSFSESNNTHQLTGIDGLFRENNECHNNAPFSPTCYYPKKTYMHGHSFSSISSEGLSHCTEGLGSESCCDEVEEFGNDHISLDWRHRREEKQGANVIQEQSEYMYCDHKRLRVNKELFPPPISCIGDNGRPFVRFKSYRENGRFILKEVRIPQHQFLRATRENGRLKLHLVHADDEMFEEYDEDEIVDDGDFDLDDIKEVDEDTNEEVEEEFEESKVVDDIKEVDEDTNEEEVEENFEESNNVVDDEEQNSINNENQ